MLKRNEMPTHRCAKLAAGVSVEAFWPSGINHGDRSVYVLGGPPLDDLVDVVIPEGVPDDDKVVRAAHERFKLAQQTEEWPLCSELATLPKDERRPLSVAFLHFVLQEDCSLRQMAESLLDLCPNPVDRAVEL